MKKNNILFASLALLFALSGCAVAPNNTAALTYDSKPEGARIFEGQTDLGVAPVTRTYTVPDNTTSIETPVVTAVWPSGAKATYWTQLPLHADLAATINRPSDPTGLEKDLANAAPIKAANDREAQRIKEANEHDIAHYSARCAAELKAGSAITSDCY